MGVVDCKNPLWAYTARCSTLKVRVDMPMKHPTTQRIVLVLNSFEGSKAVTRALATNVFSSADTLVISGGAPRESLVRTDKCTFFRVQHNSLDNTGLIALIDRWETISAAMGAFDSFFYSHDTVEFGPQFRSLLTSYDGSTSARLLPRLSMNMGLYTMPELRRCDHVLSHRRSENLPGLAELKSLKALNVYWEDSVFACMQTTRSLTTQERCRIATDPRRVYNGSLRLTEYMADLDLTKYKANWRALNRTTPGGFVLGS